MRKRDVETIYKLMCGHVLIYGMKGLMKEGSISRWAFLRIMKLCEKELGISRRARRMEL